MSAEATRGGRRGLAPAVSSVIASGSHGLVRYYDLKLQDAPEPQVFTVRQPWGPLELAVPEGVVVATYRS